MTARRAVLPIIVCLVLTACATVPTGPSVLVLPGTGKNFEQSKTDDAVCRQWALQQTGATPEGEPGTRRVMRCDTSYSCGRGETTLPPVWLN